MKINYYSAQLLEVDTKSALANHTYSKYVLCLLLAITRPGAPGIVILTIKPEPIMLLNLPIIRFFPEFLKNVTYYSPKVSYNS